MNIRPLGDELSYLIFDILKDLGNNVLSLAAIQRKYQRKITAARNLLKISVFR